MKAWHGTLKRFDSFTPRQGFVSFATEPDGGRIYAAPDGLGWRKESRLFEVRLSVKNLLDYRRIDHVHLITDYLSDIRFSHFPKAEWHHCIHVRGSYQCLEHEDLLKRHGFDGVYTEEWGWLNVHILDVSCIEIVTIYDDDPGDFGMIGNHNQKKGWAPRPPSRAV